MDAIFIQEMYGITPDSYFSFSGYRAFSHNHRIHIIIPVNEAQSEEIIERFQMANLLRSAKEKYVPLFLPAKNGQYIVQHKNEFFLILKLSTWRNREYQTLGKKLAVFHLRGRGSNLTNISKLNRYGLWQGLWEKRLQQLENVWKHVVLNRPENEFESIFIEVFPYFSGLCENAIQYLADTLIDEVLQYNDQATICHHRFTRSTWSGPHLWKNPFDWVVDHPVRDLAEWSRDIFFQFPESYWGQIRTTIQEYDTVAPLSSFSIRLYYSRLVFPVHFFECIEEYYTTYTPSVKKKCEKELVHIVKRSDDYEQFIKSIFDYIEFPLRKNQLPRLDWLT